MKNILKAASILSWINLIFWGAFCAWGLLAVAVSGMFFLLLAFVLVAAIPLHSYACIQLHKSIRNHSLPLNSQTSTGIRFIGFVAMFLGIGMLANGATSIQNAKQVLQMGQTTMPQVKYLTEGMVRAIGSAVLLLGIFVTVNVILNFRLLRWYLSSKDKANDQ